MRFAAVGSRFVKDARSRRIISGAAVAVAAALLVAACGSPVKPSSDDDGGTPPPNTPPVIESITVQGSRSKEPASFADAGETIAVSAKVTDVETPVDQLAYVWTATAGTFAGTGSSVTWTAPASVPSAVDVTITLAVTERYGAQLSFEQTVKATAGLSLHDSVREVGGMSRQFLLDFSDTSIKDADYIMRNFGSGARCPQPGEIQSERDDVVRNFTFFNILNFRVDPPAVSVNFGGTCPFRGKRGDACAVVGVFWDSIDTRVNIRGTTSGNDIIAAAYSAPESRWWLCASDYQGVGSFAAHFGR